MKVLKLFLKKNDLLKSLSPHSFLFQKSFISFQAHSSRETMLITVPDWSSI